MTRLGTRLGLWWQRRVGRRRMELASHGVRRTHSDSSNEYHRRLAKLVEENTRSCLMMAASEGTPRTWYLDAESEHGPSDKRFIEVVSAVDKIKFVKRDELIPTIRAEQPAATLFHLQ